MSKQHDSEGFMSTPLEGAGARPKDNYYQDSEDNDVRFREADEEYQRLKADFARIAKLDEGVLILGAIPQRALHH